MSHPNRRISPDRFRIATTILISAGNFVAVTGVPVVASSALAVAAFIALLDTILTSSGRRDTAQGASGPAGPDAHEVVP